MKRVFVGVCFAVGFILITMHIAGAEILFSAEPTGLYNLGDSVSANFSVSESYAVSDYVQAYVLCDGEKFIVKKEYTLIQANTKTYFGFEFPAPIKGDCKLFADFNNEEESTNNFTVSDKILIDYSVSSLSFFPGDSVSVFGSAEKENGNFFDGTVNLKIADQSFTAQAVNGNFSFNFNLANDVSPGNYDLAVSAKDDFSNSGNDKKNVKIKPKPTSISIGFDNNSSISLPYNFLFDVTLLDQSGNLISNETVSVKIFSPLNERIAFQKGILSGEGDSYFFEENSTPGQWKINAYFGSIFYSRDIVIPENRKVAFERDENNNLFVRNAGNVPYNGGVNFNLTDSDGSEKEVSFNVDNLGVGKSEQVKLDNYNGNYTLNFENNTLEGVSITGNSFFFLENNISLRSYIISFSILLVLVIAFLSRKKVKVATKKIFRKKDPDEKILLKESFNEKKEKKKTDEKKIVSTRVNACMIFIEFSKLIEMDDLFEAYGFSFRPVADNIGYVLFYSSPDKNPEKKMLEFARSAKRFAQESGGKISIVLNSAPFRGMEEVKAFASFNRKLLGFSDGEILIPRNVCRNIKIGFSRKMKKLHVSDKEVEVCVL